MNREYVITYCHHVMKYGMTSCTIMKLCINDRGEIESIGERERV